MRNTFDVFKEMCDKDLDIRSAPLANIVAINENTKGAQVTIGVDKPTARKLIMAEKEYPFVGGLILADKEQFHVLANKEVPKIICLCGSLRFKAEYEELEMKFIKEGALALLPSYMWVDAERSEDLNHLKPILDEFHLRKIDLADEVFIINVDGYIGESTAREIEYAKKHNKVINYLEPVKE